MSCTFTYCNEEHPPVWYFDDTQCPVCRVLMIQEESKELIEEMETNLYDATAEIDRLQGKISDFEDEKF